VLPINQSINNQKGEINACFQTSKNRLTVLLGVNAAGSFKLSQNSFTIPEILKSLCTILNPLYLYTINKTTNLG
jgi:hypothetical protein